MSWCDKTGNRRLTEFAPYEVYNPELDATIVISMNSDKKVNGEQGIHVLPRDISKILFPNNPVNVPVIKSTDNGAPLLNRRSIAKL